MNLNDVLNSITPIDSKAAEACIARFDQVSKPVGSLGKLEELLARIAAVTGSAEINISRKAVIVCCADNGVVRQGVAQCGHEVTTAVAGMLGIGKAIMIGVEIVKELKDKGYQLIATGEAGIGNTTTSSAICSVLLNRPVSEATGRGAGLDDDGLHRNVLAMFTALSAAGLLLVAFPDGFVALVLCLPVTIWYRSMTKKYFGGVTGDTTGFYLQTLELILLAGLLADGGNIMAILERFALPKQNFYDYHVPNCGFFLCRYENSALIIERKKP